MSEKMSELRVDAAKFKEMLELLARPLLGFSDAVMISGIDARQLRNGLDRGIFKVGKKLGTIGRWGFTGMDCLQLMQIDQLVRNVQLPVSLAANIAAKLADLEATFLRDAIDQAEAQGPEGKIQPIGITANIAFDAAGPTVFVERIGYRAGVYDILGNPADGSFRHTPHLVLPVGELLAEFMRRATLLNMDSLS